MNTRSEGLRLLHMARCEGGAIAPIVGVMLPMMFGMLGLVEAGRVYGVKNQLQATADAAAMASVHKVDILGDVEDEAETYAERNMPAAEQHGGAAVLVAVAMGNWDADRAAAERFKAHDAGGTPVNAVRVTTLAEMPLFFAGALQSLGVGAPDSFTPSAEATALLRPDKCYSNGFVAGGIVDINSSNAFKAGFCAYGHDGVTMNSSNNFEAGTGVGMANLADLDAGDNNPGHEAALFQRDIAPPASGSAMQLIDDLIAGTGPIPDYITSTQTVSQMPDTLVPGTMYIYTGTNAIELNDNVQTIAVISDYPIKIKSNSILRNVVLASRKSVDINSNVEIGDADFCDTGLGASLIVAAGTVSDKDVPVGTNSNIFLHGVQVVSDGHVDMNSNLTVTSVSVQAQGNIAMNSSSDMAACPDGTSANVTGGGTMVSQLVD